MHRTTLLPLAVTLLLPLGGCDLDDLPELDRSGELDTEEARPRHHRHEPPPLMLLRVALETGDLQRAPAMEESLAAMKEAHGEARAARDGLRLALVPAVQAGRLSADAFEAELAAIVSTARVEANALAVALNAAHGLLDPEQRDEVLAARPEPPPPSSEGHRPPPGPAGHLLRELQLDQSQHEALRAALGEPRPPTPPRPMELDGFAEEDFDAASLGLADLHATHSREQAIRHIDMLSALLPLLDESQRATVVELLQKGPPEPRTPAA